MFSFWFLLNNIFEVKKKKNPSPTLLLYEEKETVKFVCLWCKRNDFTDLKNISIAVSAALS